MSENTLADRFIEALMAGDEATVRECYADDAVIWHNFDGTEQTVDDNVASLHWLRRIMDNMSYTEIRRTPITGGVLQQHVLSGSIGGDAVAVPACVILKIEDDRIIRLEEYLDPTPITSRVG